jgi:hypothetical protein
VGHKKLHEFTVQNDSERLVVSVVKNPLLNKTPKSKRRQTFCLYCGETTTDGKGKRLKVEFWHAVPDRPSLRRYRSAKHNTFIGSNGSIQVQDLDHHVVLDKPGLDGRKTGDLNA